MLGETQTHLQHTNSHMYLFVDSFPFQYSSAKSIHIFVDEKIKNNLTLYAQLFLMFQFGLFEMCALHIKVTWHIIQILSSLL